jgi:serpin B
MRPLYRRIVRAVLVSLLACLPFLGSGPPGPRNIVLPDISNRINAFTLDLLKHYAGTAKAKENAILSPQSIFSGLAISYVGSDGETRRELARILHFPQDDRKLLKELKNLRRQREVDRNNKKVELNMASSLWLDQTYARFRDDYIKSVQDALSASLYCVAFRDASQVSERINGWVSEQTHGLIKRVVTARDFESRSTPDEINEPALAVVDAVYFKADWTSRFEEGATKNLPFHVDRETVRTASMMHQNATLAYSTDEVFRFLELPYADGQYSMYVLLPQKILDIREAMTRVSMERIIDLKRHSAARNVDVLLPKFTVERHYSIKDAFARLGVKTAFDKHSANFDKMIIKRMEAYRIYVSEIYHDAWIEVHEAGTKAAAVTTTTHYSIGCSVSRDDTPVSFHADHPFLFAIVDNRSYDILFAGWITNPGSAVVGQ